MMSTLKRIKDLISRMKPDNDIAARKVKIGRIPAIILEPSGEKENSAGVLWIHGGGYFIGMKEMVYLSRAVSLVKKFGVTVVAPGYRQALQAPYPAALIDCYNTLLYMKKNAADLGIEPEKIIVGGESAGGGLTAALCMLVRDRGTAHIARQFPLYPMLDNFDTESSGNNHGRVWNTNLNHLGWRLYLRRDARKTNLSPYASPARQADFTGLPPAYTFVGSGEPFYAETLEYVRKLQAAGVEAKADVYETDIHAFDMLLPEKEISIEAGRRFEEEFEKALE